MPAPSSGNASGRPPLGVLPHGLHQPAPDTVALESALADVELQLEQLRDALMKQDAELTERAASELRTALGGAVERFAQVSRRGVVPPQIRRRLALASGQVAAQREALARATSALDQALEILIPRPTPASVYSAAGGASRGGPGRIIAAS
jgi:multidrug resistance efflux pump